MLREISKKVIKKATVLLVVVVVFFVAKNAFAQQDLGINALADQTI